MPPPSQPCPVCAKPFGKRTKLEAHLLEEHGAELRLSPGRLDTDDRLSSHLADAVRAANAAFAAAPAHAPCPRCPHARPFRNARALAQHLLIKHLQPPDDVTDPTTMVPPPPPSVAASKVEPAVHPTSEISCNPRKRPAVAAAASAAAVTPEAKRARTTSPAPAAEPKMVSIGLKMTARQTVSAKPAPAKAALADPTPSGASPVTTTAKKAKSPPKPSADKNAVKAKSGATSNAKRRASAPAALSDVPASGTKPPITPRKPARSKTTPPAASPPVVPWLSNPTVRIPVPTTLSTAPMDFTSIGGFAANSRKPYYRLAGR